MKVPKYIKSKLEKRARLAWTLNVVDAEVAEWLDENEIEVESCYTRGGCAMYVEPELSMEAVLEAIEEK